MLRYTIRPRPTGDGWALSGPGLAFPLWYRDQPQAESMARHLIAGRGGCIVFQRADGSAEWQERVEPTGGPEGRACS